MSASSAYSELESILTKLAEAYRGIVTALRNEREALIAFDFAALNELNTQKEALCFEVQRLEGWREMLFEDFRVTYQIQEAPLKLASLMPSLPAETRERIEVLSQELEVAAEACRELHDSNQKFVEHSLKNIQALKENYLQHLTTASTTYSRDGKVDASTPPLVRRKV